jgi:hypothetical protein
MALLSRVHYIEAACPGQMPEPLGLGLMLGLAGVNSVEVCTNERVVVRQ